MSNEVLLCLGRRLRELRLERKLTQESVADRSGLHLTYVAGIEGGRRNPTVLSLSALASGLSTSLSDLLAGVPAEAKE